MFIKTWEEFGRAVSAGEEVEFQNGIGDWAPIIWGQALSFITDAMANNQLRIQPETITLYEYKGVTGQLDWFESSGIKMTKTGRVIRNAVIENEGE